MGSFLQSRGWEEFQKSLGRKTWRIHDALFILHELPGGFSYLYAPRPIIDSEYFSLIIAEAQKIARHHNSIFVRIEPEIALPELPHEYTAIVSDGIQPKESLILNIQKSEQELISGMHPKTRYNIKLAEKHGVSVKIFWDGGGGEELFESFWRLLSETVQRNGFQTHSKRHYQKLVSLHASDLKIALAVATVRGRSLATALIALYEDRAIYLHGASSSHERNVMAPYFLHWSIICELKKQGVYEYDWWGIDGARWPGVTRFKKGFGGREVLYSEGIDIVFRPFWYRVYRIRSIIKGFF